MMIDELLLLAVERLRAGQLVIFPTETVYGLGADAANPDAVARLYALKGRPATHPVIVHVSDVHHMVQWAREIPPVAYALAAAFWPGPLTMVLKRQPWVNPCITGGQDTVAIRVPRHPLALQLLHVFGGALVAPSANRFGQLSPTTPQAAREAFAPEALLVLDGGPCHVGIESTILDLTHLDPTQPQVLRVLRSGMLTPQLLQAVAGCPVFGPHPHTATSETRVPGALASHYAPKARVVLKTAEQLMASVAETKTITVLALTAQRPESVPSAVHWQQMPLTAQAYAATLYECMRQADMLGSTAIWVELPSAAQLSFDPEEWAGIVDRLTRAAF